jgi:hypothetical protein
MFLVKMLNKIKEKIIHWLGGFTKEEYENTQAISNSALTKLEESHKALQASLHALEHAVEDSRATGAVNVVRIEKPIKALTYRYSYDHGGDESKALEYAKRYVCARINEGLYENDLVDFKVEDNVMTGEIDVTGKIYIVEP